MGLSAGGFAVAHIDRRRLRLRRQVPGRASTVVDAPPVVSGSNRFSPLTEIDNEMAEAGTTSGGTAGREDVSFAP